jgi:endonuclease/exonuclease/phosphatase family metal-dependent hydrolase
VVKKNHLVPPWMRLGRARASVVKCAALGVAFGAAMLRAEVLTVATYNVENYLAVDRRIEGIYRPAYPKPEAAKQVLRAVIRGLAADVLALQEMGPPGYLEELRRDLRAEGLDYPHVALAEASDPDRHLAVISRVPFRSVRTVADLDFSYFGAREKVKRGLLEITLAAVDGDWTLFVVHLRSRHTERLDDPASALCRAGEAEAIRNHVLARFPDPATARFLILGDCNDLKDSKPLRLLARRGATPKHGPTSTARKTRTPAWTIFSCRGGWRQRWSAGEPASTMVPARAGRATTGRLRFACNSARAGIRHPVRRSRDPERVTGVSRPRRWSLAQLSGFCSGETSAD